jgi:phosphoribosylformylglycinamidine synthase
MPAIEDFWRKGGFVMGICNGFQILVEAGWLPGALLRNQSGRFICTVTTIVPQLMPSHPLRDYLGERPYRLPIAHGDGRYVVAKGEIPPHRFRYLPIAPNGSQYHIAGLVNAEGTVLGLMPHPERACDPYQGQSDGLDFLRAIARYVAFRV